MLKIKVLKNLYTNINRKTKLRQVENYYSK